MSAPMDAGEMRALVPSVYDRVRGRGTHDQGVSGWPPLRVYLQASSEPRTLVMDCGVEAVREAASESAVFTGIHRPVRHVDSASALGFHAPITQ